MCLSQIKFLQATSNFCLLLGDGSRQQKQIWKEKKKSEVRCKFINSLEIFGKLIISYRIFFPLSNCRGEEKKIFHLCQTQWWCDGHTWHVFPSCQGHEELGCTCPSCWPSQAHKEKTGDGRCEGSWIRLPTRGNCFYDPAKLTSVKNPSNIPAVLTLGCTHNQGGLFARCHPPNLSLRRLVTFSIPHWILTEEHFILQIAASGDRKIK